VKKRWKVLLVTSVAVFMGFLDVTIVNIAFPDIEASFPDTSLAGLSWILNAYNIVFAALLVPAGRLSDRLGRRRTFVVQAAGAAILVPTSLALLLPEFPLEQRATATALWGATGAIAAATGPSLGGVLVDATSWRWVFFVNLVIGLPALIPARRLLTETRDEHPGPLPDAAGALMLVVGVGLLSLGIVKGEDWGWGGGRVIGSLVLRSARHPAPVIELSLLRVRSFAVANVGVFLFALGFYAVLLANILFLTSVWDWSVLRAGVSVTPGPLMAALSAPIGGRLADRYGQRVVALPGGLLFAAGCLVFAASIGATPHYASEFLPATILTGAGVGLSFAAWGSAAVAELPPSRFATGSAISSTSRQLGAVLGIAILVAVLGTPSPEDAVSTFHTAWRLMALPTAIAGLLALALGRVRARDPEAAAAAAEA
jgi:EmrB/QacA subfamily drug resistance transporter